MLGEHEFFCFVSPDNYRLGWDGTAFVHEVKQWRKWFDLQEFGESQFALGALDLEYMPAIATLSVAQLHDGPDCGKWAVLIDVDGLELKRAA